MGRARSSGASKIELVERRSHELDPTGKAYPRPQFRRGSWMSLNGTWAFALDTHLRWKDAAEVEWDRTIEVPFAPETAPSFESTASAHPTEATSWFTSAGERDGNVSCGCIIPGFDQGPWGKTASRCMNM